MIRFTVYGPPRTKKSHSRIVKCGNFPKVLPSLAHEEWFKNAMTQAPVILDSLRATGQNLPITEPVNLAAVFYRERASGDLCGFLQALGDYLQAPRTLPSGKKGRSGAGIIADDALIASFDGSRLAKDATNPRIEVTIEVSA